MILRFFFYSSVSFFDIGNEFLFFILIAFLLLYNLGFY